MKKNKDKKKQQFRLLNCGDASELSKFKKRTKMGKVGKFISRPDDSGKFFDNLITVETTAEALGVAPKTIRKWVAVRVIPHVRIGHRIMFRPKSLELWLTRKEEKSWL